jgi:hypothetical protein
MRGTTLVKLLDLYRAECRLSLNPAHNAQVRDAQVNHIQRTQEWLWGDFEWPLLRVERYIEVADGQRYYGLPDDLDIDRLTKVEIRHDDVYQCLTPGIDAEHYSAYDSDKDERQWPPQRWRISEDEQMEIWPIPDGSYDPVSLEGRIKLTGIKQLSPLVDDGDRADLDDRLIILFCAAENLAASGAKDASFKLQQAQKRLATLRGHQSPVRRFTMFGGVNNRSDVVKRVPLAVYNKPSS